MFKNPIEIYQFCKENLTIVFKESSVIPNRCYILVDPSKVKTLKDKIDTRPYKSVKGTLKLQLRT